MPSDHDVCSRLVTAIASESNPSHTHKLASLSLVTQAGFIFRSESHGTRYQLSGLHRCTSVAAQRLGYCQFRWFWVREKRHASRAEAESTQTSSYFTLFTILNCQIILFGHKKVGHSRTQVFIYNLEMTRIGLGPGSAPFPPCRRR
jgi:hypothetical protein